MQHLHHAEAAALGELRSLIATRLYHLHSQVHHCRHCSIKRQSRGGREEKRGKTFSVCLPARIKCEPSLSTPWVITHVVVDLHLSFFSCQEHWLHRHKSGKVQYLTLPTPLPCLLCNSNQSLEVSIVLV